MRLNNHRLGGRVLTTLLFSQQTASAEHSLPVPTPMTVIGEQSRPTRTSRSWRTMPRRPRRVLMPGDEACRMWSITQVKASAMNP